MTVEGLAVVNKINDDGTSFRSFDQGSCSVSWKLRAGASLSTRRVSSRLQLIISFTGPKKGARVALMTVVKAHTY